MQSFVKYCKTNRRMPLFMLCWQAGFFLFGMIMVLVINALFNDEPDYACLGTLLSLLAVFIGGFLRIGGSLTMDYRLAVSMGFTRRSYLASCPIVTALLTIQGFLTSWLLYFLEKALYSAIYPNFVNEVPLEVAFQWWVLPLAIAVLIPLGLFVTALNIRLGSKAFLYVWIIFCLCFAVLPNTVNSALDGGTSLLARLGRGILSFVSAVPVTGWIAIGIVLAVAALVFSVWTLVRAEVKL